jgi:putative transposase
MCPPTPEAGQNGLTWHKTGHTRRTDRALKRSHRARSSRSDPCAPQLFNWRVSHYQRQAKHDWPWHDRRVIALADLLVQLLGDLVVLVFLAARPTRSLAAENLLLRRQIALYLQRGTKPPRIDAATRITLAWLSRLCDRRSALVVVRPQTVIRWHRAGWRLLWRYKSRPGRPPIPHELRHLIRRMANENPLWGEERIANELLVKLGVRLSPRTVRKYMPKQPSGRPRGDQRWATFLRNHAQAIVACDFFVAVTANFWLLYVFVVIHHGSRQLLHFNVTAHPSAAWTLQQLR